MDGTQSYMLLGSHCSLVDFSLSKTNMESAHSLTRLNRSDAHKGCTAESRRENMRTYLHGTQEPISSAVLIPRVLCTIIAQVDTCLAIKATLLMSFFCANLVCLCPRRYLIATAERAYWRLRRLVQRSSDRYSGGLFGRHEQQV